MDTDIEHILKDRLSPRWLRDIIRLLPIRPQFVLSGNIRDSFLIPVKPNGHQILPFRDCLWKGLKPLGFEFLVYYDPVDGITFYPDECRHAAERAISITEGQGQHSSPDSLADLASVIRRIATAEQRVALVLDYASRISISPERLSEDEHRFFVACEKLVHTCMPRFKSGLLLYNPLIWLVNRVQDLPAWYVLDNDLVHGAGIDTPGWDQRHEAALILLDDFSGASNIDQEERKSHAKQFADMTDGFSLQAMAEIAQMARLQETPLSELDDAVRSHKVGDPALKNPWASDSLKDRIRSAQEELEKRIYGQDQAIRHALDILKRSVMGLTGAHITSSHGRPRGVLFLAGPTGVGKTELAKGLTKAIFGDEEYYIRFDMSEFSAEHADQRLLGAPPGYVGYEAGGELVNKVRQRPFSLILFDEIDKANPKILDKFLQILEDGRLTSGRGETVHFSETLIVFTTNRGVSERLPDGTYRAIVEQGAPYEVVEEKIMHAIKDYFINVISRPELLNRLGDNIVVFGFIDRQVANRIFSTMIDNIKRRVQDEHDCELVFSDQSMNKLLEWCTKDLSMGGRGIGSRLETTLVNPLARAMFDLDIEKGIPIKIDSVVESNGIYEVRISQ